MKYFCGFLFLIFSFSSASAQQNWGGGVDDEALHWGFSFQYIMPQYKILKTPNWRDPFVDEGSNSTVTTPLTSISSPASPGMGLGFVTDLRLGDNANLRFTPSLSFADRVIYYEYDTSIRQKKIPATMGDFPLGIKIKSDRRNNFRAYLLGGVKYSIDIISAKKNDDSGNIATEKFVKNKRNILTYETGVGFDIYFEWFKMSPEIKLSNSFRSVLKQENNPYSAPLDKLFLHSVQFSLYFE
ncbi:MAG TPA: porin [Sphingobacteriaceae bacterium]|nr:porin [Sphingobacteriaceae bacterium]